MSSIERETKLLISPEDYRGILGTAAEPEPRDQLNIYLLDPSLLHAETGYVRVRFETGRPGLATLKVPVGWSGHVREMLELEYLLSEFGPGLHPRPRRWVTLDTDGPEDFLGHLRSMGMTRLRRLGWMRNLRTVVRLPEGDEVEVDRTILPDGRVHYEVEIEHPVKKRHHSLVELVRAMAPSARVSKTGKFNLFLSALDLR
jgi:hypothetical protein